MIFIGFHQRDDPVERAGHGLDRAGRDLGVDCGRVDLGVAEQHLDDADIDVLLDEVGGEAVAQGMPLRRSSFHILPL